MILILCDNDGIIHNPIPSRIKKQRVSDGPSRVMPENRTSGRPGRVSLHRRGKRVNPPEFWLCIYIYILLMVIV